MGDEILPNVKSEMEQTVKHIKLEVSDIVESQNLPSTTSNVLTTEQKMFEYSVLDIAEPDDR